MSSTRRCTECGAPLPDDVPNSSCALCVLRGALTIPQASESPGTEKVGGRIGRYKLLERIGEGGYGSVYMAEQLEPIRRRVALKVVKLGMDTREVIARFEAERQALALMDHPNIARVLDAGATDTGRPYFVMELVPGIRITRYCDECKLSTEERLHLFIQVCNAIQHAHQKGIIHRDIKPSNILVSDQDGKLVLKVIDFGIAKATSGQTLTDKTLVTTFEQFVGTPAYTSPEQAKLRGGHDIDTRTDIYSLGVLLYELLTGNLPFDSKRFHKSDLDEIRRIIREEDPPRPSTRLSTLDAKEQTRVALCRQSDPPRLIADLRGDLDWIVMKALEKDRRRRYETVESLRMDIQRFLGNEPITAAAPSTFYRVQKFAKRHKASLAAISLVLLALLTAVIVSTWSALRMRQLWKIAKAARSSEARANQQVRAALTRVRLQRAEELFPTDPSRAIVTLASLLRSEPTNRVVAERLLNALSQRSFLVPALAPFPAGCSLARSSRDGRYIVTAFSSGSTNAVRVFERTGRLAAELPQGAAPVNVIDVNSNGSVVAAAAADRVRVWSVPRANLILNHATRAGTVRQLRLLPQEQLLVVAGGTVALWRLTDGSVLHEFKVPDAILTCAAVSEAAGLLVTADNSATLRLHDLATLELRHSMPRAHAQPIRDVRFSPDGSLLVSAGADSVARVWNTQSGQATAELPHQAAVYTARFSPDGRHIATASRDQTAQLWDVTGNRVGRPMLHKNSVNSVDFSPDGRFLATADDDGYVRVWDIAGWTDASMPVRFDRAALDAGFVAGDNDLLVSLAKGGVHLLRRTTKAAWWRTTTPAATGQLKLTKAEHTFFAQAHRKEITFEEVSPDGRLAVTASGDGIVRIWDRQSRTRVGEPLLHNEEAVSCARFSPDSRRIVTSTSAHKIRVWDVQSGAPLTDWLETDTPVSGVRFAEDNSAIITADGWACPIHIIQGPVPAWLPKLAEAVARVRYNEEGLEEPVLPSTFLELNSTLSARRAADPLIACIKQLLRP